MTSVRARVALCGALLLGLLATEAEAWGPVAQRAITRTAIQRLQERLPGIFQAGQQNYQAEVVRGAEDGAQALVEAMNIRTDRDAIEAIGNQILLLREVRNYGVGSYYAYRLGLLSAIVSDVLLPYALDTSEGASELKARIEGDIDEHVTGYRFLPERNLQTVRNVRQYIESYRPFYTDAKRLIGEDYRSGSGYAGYLSKAAPTFFGEAVQATADVWYTILRASEGVEEVKPSPQTVAWYFVNEMEYLLKVKRNVAEASKKYAIFERVNPGIPATYERIGDLFYAYGTASRNNELRERAVREWENAMDLGGADRHRLSEKLSGYYLDLGKVQVDEARKPGGYKRLNEAIASFSRGLEYLPDNTEAERLLSETRTLKREMDEALETQTNIINSAEQVMKQAEQSERVQDYTNALVWYSNAAELFSKVNEQFPELKQAADDRRADIQRRINTIKEESLKRARETIAKGDEALEANDFDGAIDTYNSIEQILAPITDDPTSPHGKKSMELKEERDRKVRAAEEARDKFKAQQQQMQQGAPGAPGAPAAPGAPGAPGAPALSLGGDE